MVRNLSGGGNAKRQARKHQGGNNNTNVLRRSQCELEKYAIVRKLSGGSICVVMDEDGNELNCHMGGKFRGRNKRQNIVEKGNVKGAFATEAEADAAFKQGRIKKGDRIKIGNTTGVYE